MELLINTIKSVDYDTFGKTPKILLVSPIKIDRDIENVKYANYDLESAEKSELLADLYKEVATKTGCYFFDAGTVAKASKVDCLHMDQESHEKLAKSLKIEIEKIFI